MQSLEGLQPTRPSQEGQQAQSRPSSGALPVGPSDRVGDWSQEQYLEALFRDLDGNPAEHTRRQTAAYILLGTGVVLIAIGSLGIMVIRGLTGLAALVVGVNALAWLCIALGFVLLPEVPPPSPREAGGAWFRGRFHVRRARRSGP